MDDAGPRNQRGAPTTPISLERSEHQLPDGRYLIAYHARLHSAPVETSGRRRVPTPMAAAAPGNA